MAALYSIARGVNKKSAPSLLTRGNVVVCLKVLAQRNNVRGLQSLGAFFDGELDLLAFNEVAKAICLDGREVDEHVLAAFAGDEAITLATVEPLDCADDFSDISFFLFFSFVIYLYFDASFVFHIGTVNKNKPRMCILGHRLSYVQR